MGRIANALLANDQSYAAGSQNPMLDLQYGGMNGWSPNLAEWVSNTGYVRRNIVALVMEAPRGFKLLPQGDSYVKTFRALVELHAQSITGLNDTLTVDVAETPVGGAGQRHQDPINVVAEVSNVTMRIPEKYGLPVNTFFSSWIRNLIMDENSKFASIATYGNAPADMLADMFAATILFFEPDPTHTKVTKAWLGTNMFPLTSGEYTGQRDLTAAMEVPTYDINWSGVFQTGVGVKQFAQQILSGISITGANPYARPAFISGIDADVAAATKGYAQGITDLANNSVKV